MSIEAMKTKKFLYHHRTQGEGVEGVHIRGMVDGFKKCGYIADIIGPPGVDPYSVKEAGGSKEKPGLLKKIWSCIGEKAPQIFFETLEVSYNFYVGRKLLKKVRKGNYEFIYERYALNTFIGAWIARRAKLPFILEVNDATVIERSRPLVLRKLARYFEKKVFARADLVITITEHFKSLILSNYAIPENKILVLPNAIDPERFVLAPERRLSRACMGIGEGQLVLGCVGAFVPWHGLEFLIESMAEMVKEHDLFFLFIGDGPVRPVVEKLARECGIEKRVCFTGFMSSEVVPSYLDLVDICVIPGSNAHCSPMKLFEYMAMGKPIVLPTYRPLQETLAADVEGVFFKPGEGNSFKAAILKVITDMDLRLTLGRNALEKVRATYTWGINARRVIDTSLLGFDGCKSEDEVGIENAVD